MKAKEYAEEFNKDPSFKNFHAIANKFYHEIKVLIDIRHVQTDSAVLAIFKEQDLKWQAFALKCNGMIKVDGFRLIAKEQFPEISKRLGWG